ncbi:hypothetical protein RRH01S_12_00980 [Rhizobium rhizogenes NBRC 13257]|uniref:DUF736 domain-containing protein n=1 Tax=Rhizobium rhizogenes NBRC 13257 TaxID=1220581 RepID=A0AA87QBQ9_RHIRH|nr:hypothetical protein RRH01S_12_00980 [Rhizobium rhizogenes NBRC 13257]
MLRHQMHHTGSITMASKSLGGSVELGAAWQKTSGEGRDYLSVKLDDPSFPAPIYATLTEVEGEDGLQLIWSRPNRD